MRKVPILIILGLVVFGCSYDPNPLYENIKGFYEAPHRLRKMFVEDREITVKEPSETRFSGGLFFFIGGISGSHREGAETSRVVTHVRFAWEIENDTYIITTLPLEKIRIKVVEDVELPSASFFLDMFAINEASDDVMKGSFSTGEAKQKFERKLGRILTNYYNPHETFSRYLDYVVFTVKSGDWPANINLPVNQSSN